MEIVEYIVYIFATIVMLLIGPIVMIVTPNRTDEDVRDLYTEKEGYRKKVSVAIILQILSILVLLDLWKIVEIF